MWVVICDRSHEHKRGRWYRTPRGQEKSYTNRLESAATWPTKEAAEREGLCGNERAVRIENVMGGEL